MSNFEPPSWLQEFLNDGFIVMHVCVLASGLFISSLGFALASL